MPKGPQGQKRYPIHSRTKGSMGQNDDWWELVVKADGQRIVVHSWCHMDPYKGTAPLEGERELSLDDFSGDKHGKGLAAELSVAMKKADENA